MNEQISLFLLWMDTLMKQQSNSTENLQLLFDSTTKMARTGSAQGTESGVLNR